MERKFNRGTRMGAVRYVRTACWKPSLYRRKRGYPVRQHERVDPIVSSSTTLVMLTANGPLYPCILNSMLRADAAFHLAAQWIDCAGRALSAQSARGMFQMPELTIASDKVAFLIEKAREFDVKEAASDPDSGSNGADDDMVDVLEDNGSDPVVREITGFISALTEDEQIDLVALMRLGRGDGTLDDWDDLRTEAAEQRNGRTARYLLGEPMLGDLWAEGLAAFGVDWTDERITPDSSSESDRDEDEITKQ
jgi:hypothetical protein